MKAIVCTQYGPPEALELQDIPSPSLGEGQVRIKVKTVGINYVEGLMIQGLYQIKIPTPFVPCSDLVGVVTEVGPGVRDVETGQRVMGVFNVGALAEEIVVYAQQLVQTPDGMSDAAGSVFLQANSTAYFALVNCGKIRSGETVLVLGAAGATGLASIYVAKALGARVIAAASTDEKLQACRTAGADETINYVTEDLKARAKQLTERGVDLVFDPVGGELSEAALRACAPGARFLVIGFASGTIAKIPLNLPLLKRCNIVGVNWGASFMDDPSINPEIFKALVSLYQQGKLPCPPIEEFPLDESARAFSSVLDRSCVARPVVRVG